MENMDQSTVNISTATDDGTVLKIHFSNKEFNDLITEKKYPISHSKKLRAYKVYVPGKWQTMVTKKLWEEHRITCGFLFQRGRVHKETATMTGLFLPLHLPVRFNYGIGIKILNFNSKNLGNITENYSTTDSLYSTRSLQVRLYYKLRNFRP